MNDHAEEPTSKATGLAMVYEELFDLSPEAIVILDPKGKLLDINRRLTEWLGYQPDDVKGKLLLSQPFLTTKAKAIVAEKFALRLAGRDVPPYEIELKAHDGRRIIGRVHGRIVKDANGKTIADLVMVSEVTSEEEAKEKLRESEARYSALFNSSPEGIVMVDIATKQLLYANPAICKMLGYSQDDLLQKRVDDIHPKESLPMVFGAFEAQAKGLKPLAQNIPCLRSDGTVFYADINTSPAEIGGKMVNVGFFRDVTERHKTEDAYYKMQHGIELSKDVVFITDPDGIITYANPAFETLYGYAKDDWQGKTPRILKSGEQDKAFYEDLWKRIMAKQPIVVRLVNKAKSDARIVVESSINPIVKGDEIIGYLSIQRDIREHEALISEMQLRNEELERLNKLMVGREVRMTHLKEEIAALKESSVQDKDHHAGQHNREQEISGDHR